MVNRERLKVSKVIDNTIHDGLEGSLDSAILFLQKMKETYPDAYISYENISGSYDPNPQYGLALKTMVDETDSEYANRIANAEHYEKMREDSERKQYEALKAKFEN